MTETTTEFTDLSALDRDALSAFAEKHDVTVDAEANDDAIRAAILDADLDADTVATATDLVGAEALTEDLLAKLKKSQLVDLADARNIEYTSKSTVDELVANIVGNVKAEPKVDTSGEGGEAIENGAQALFEHANPGGVGWDSVQVAVRERYLGYAQVVLEA